MERTRLMNKTVVNVNFLSTTNLSFISFFVSLKRKITGTILSRTNRNVKGQAQMSRHLTDKSPGSKWGQSGEKVSDAL